MACRLGDPLRLGFVDVVTARHCAHGALARILVLQAAEQVVQQTLAQRPVRHFQPVDAQHSDQFDQDGQAAGPDLRPPFRQSRHLQRRQGSRSDDALDQFLERFVGQVSLHDADRVGDTLR